MGNNSIDWQAYLSNAEVVYMDAESIQPTESNPRFIKDAAFRQLMQDILRDKDFLKQRPILVNKTDKGNFIYAGHQRWRACMELGIPVPVSVDVDLPKEVMERRMILDNVHFGVFDSAKFSDFDEEMLGDLGLDTLDGRLEGKVRGYRSDDEELQAEAKNRLKNSTNDRVEKEDTITHGAHEVTIIFSDTEERDLFHTLAKNLVEDGERVEDYLIRKIRENYGS